MDEQPAKPRHVVRGARVTPVKRELAHRMRREMTAEEALLWARLRRNQLDGLHFRRQQVINGFVANFYCHAARLVVEIDGPIHRNQQGDDAARDAAMIERGFAVLRIVAEDVRKDMGGVLKRIRHAIQEIVSRD